ncbi:DUF4872 domain-containing protein [Roseateles sp. BYS180W]|uniref:DUF4872 domain-containing protein n=1 Tax=Roseateles rivi TaxID=3299028 RepID=A0ABW7FU00_9BURK
MSRPAQSRYQHRAGANCESACLRNALAAQGLALEEEVVFGLDGNIGFALFEREGPEPDLVVGRQTIFPGQALRLLGCSVQAQQRTPLSRLRQWLAQGEVVVARVDLAALPHHATLEGASAPFGGYFVNLCGQLPPLNSDGEGEFLVSDPACAELLRVPVDQVQQARLSSACPPINPNGWCYVLGGGAQAPALERLGPAALAQSAREMLRPALKQQGCSGLLQLQRRVAQWPELKRGTLPPPPGSPGLPRWPALTWQLRALGSAIELWGTGGGLFRPLWTRFIERVAQALPDPALNAAATHIARSAQAWQHMGQTCLSLTPSSSAEALRHTLNEVQRLLSLLIPEERLALEHLAQADVRARRQHLAGGPP